MLSPEAVIHYPGELDSVPAFATELLHKAGQLKPSCYAIGPCTHTLGTQLLFPGSAL